ncbi:MAG: secondary thiamine-phosphate synthase enzyme YjbQ [Bacteroidales bacterium]
MQKVIQINTHKHNGLYDITDKVKSIVKSSGIKTGMVNVYAQGATAAIMIQENWDDSVQNDVVSLLNKLIPHGVWQHDHQDNNGDAHLKAGIVGPSETIPIVCSEPGLSTWQHIFFCEFDGPRNDRKIVVTVHRCEDE